MNWGCRMWVSHKVFGIKWSKQSRVNLEESLDSAGLAERENEFIGMNVFQRLTSYVVRTVHKWTNTVRMSSLEWMCSNAWRAMLSALNTNEQTQWEWVHWNECVPMPDELCCQHCTQVNKHIGYINNTESQLYNCEQRGQLITLHVLYSIHTFGTCVIFPSSAENWRPFCSGCHSLMRSDNVLCFICAPVTQCWPVSIYWLLQTDFVDIVQCDNAT